MNKAGGIIGQSINIVSTGRGRSMITETHTLREFCQWIDPDSEVPEVSDDVLENFDFLDSGENFKETT